MSQEENTKKKPSWKDLGTVRLLLLAAAGIGLLILALPGAKPETGSAQTKAAEEEKGQEAAAGVSAEKDYAAQLEARLEKVLASVDGVGTVQVMITLKTSEETILQTDTSVSSSATKETDSGGGSRQAEDYQTDTSTVLSGGGSSGEPYVVQQIMPQIEGVIVICDGGGQSSVKTEICEAVGALFDVPAHKIKVLKRVSGKS